MKKKSLLNAGVTLFCQLCILAFGIVFPKITVVNLGSEANGFLSTINEIFIYVALIEGGLGLTLLNTLYEPIANDDISKVSDLLTSAKRKYNNISIAYIVVSAIIGLVYPLLLSTELTYWDMALSIIAYGVGGASTIFLSSCISSYLIASGHSFIKEVVHLFIYVLTSISKIILILLTKNIVLVCCSHSVFCIIEGLVYKYYFNRHFTNISLNKTDFIQEEFDEGKYFLIHQISGVIFNATDLFTISIFCSLNDASIYSVYALIFSAISTVMMSIFSSLKYILGQAYSKNIEYYKKVHDIFDSIYLAVMFALLFVAYVLANGFVGVYMQGADINYVDKWLPLLFVITKLLSCCRNVCNNTHNIAHKVKENIVPTMLEAFLNLSISIILANIIGVYGVLFGTIIALLFRTNQTIIYTNKTILKRSSFCTYKIIIVYLVLFILLSVGFNKFLAPNIGSYVEFIVWGCCTTLCAIVVFGSACLTFSTGSRELVKRFIAKKTKV